MTTMKRFFKRLFCKHDYVEKGRFIAGGINKITVYKCTKCGKEKII